MWSRTDVRWVAALTAAALLLRLVHLNSGLWVDEIYALIGSFRPPLREIVTAFPRDNHHPLYAVLAHLSLAGFGEAPWTIRLPSALFGAATVPLLYALGREVASRREALFASALLALSYHHIWFSQNARGYVLLAFFATLTTWLLLRILSGDGRTLAWCYGLAAAAGTYTHLTMVFVVAGHAVVCLALLALRDQRAALGRRLPALAIAFGSAAALTLVLYAPMLPQIREYFVRRPSRLRGVSTPAWAVLETLRVLVLGFGAGRLWLGATALFAAAGLFAAGFWGYARRNAVALGFFLTPGLIIIAGALLARGTMYPRFFFALMPFGLLLGARGVTLAAGWITGFRREQIRAAQRADRLFAAMAAGVLLLSLASLRANYRYPKQDFTGALDYVEARRTPGDVVATVGATVLPYRDYLGRDWPEVATAAELNRLRRARAVWLIYTFPRYLARSAPEIKAITDTECRAAAVFHGTIGGGDVLVCRLEPRS